MNKKILSGLFIMILSYIIGIISFINNLPYLMQVYYYGTGFGLGMIFAST